MKDGEMQTPCCCGQYTDEAGNVYRTINAGCQVHGVHTNYQGIGEGNTQGWNRRPRKLNQQ
jgi:hypothetical protein